MSEIIERIASLSAFQLIFAELKAADPEDGGAIERALSVALQECHVGLRESSESPDRLRYWLYREAVETKAQASAFLSYEKEMAKREAALWQFAIAQNERFFRSVLDALDDYFDLKNQRVIEELEKDAAWYSNLRDNAKQAAEIVRKGVSILKRGAVFLKEVASPKVTDHPAFEKAAELLDDVVSLDTRDIATKALETHLSETTLVADVQAILNEAGKRYEEAWSREIKAQTPDLAALSAFAQATSPEVHMAPRLQLGIAEQTLAVGLGGAIAGTLSLAVGWHTLAYAMVNVFYPAAIIVAVASIGLTMFRKEHDLERRRRHVREAIDGYQRHCIVQIQTGRLEAFAGKTLREVLTAQSARIVAATLAHWQQAISGNLTLDHYQKLSAACTAHLQLIQEAMQILPPLAVDHHGEQPAYGPDGQLGSRSRV